MWKKLGNEIFKTAMPSADYDTPKQLENVEYFNYLSTL
jgi:hypothetical protein